MVPEVKGVVIGMSNSNGVLATTCGGDITEVGVLLNIFFRDTTKVSQLINKGNLSYLGQNLTIPKLPFEQKEDVLSCYTASKPYRTSFTVSFNDLVFPKGPKEEAFFKPVLYKNDLQFMGLIKPKPFYFWVTAANKWLFGLWDDLYKKYEIFEMDHLFSSMPEYRLLLNNLYFMHYEPDKYEEILEIAENNLKSLIFQALSMGKMTDVEIVNDWLKKQNLNQLNVVWLSNPLGQSYHLNYVGQSAITSRSIDEMTKQICIYFGLNPFSRPIFNQ